MNTSRVMGSRCKNHPEHPIVYWNESNSIIDNICTCGTRTSVTKFNTNTEGSEHYELFEIIIKFANQSQYSKALDDALVLMNTNPDNYRKLNLRLIMSLL